MKKIAILLLLITTACSTSKINYSETELNTLKNAVDSRAVDISFEWANPVSTSALNAINSLLPPGNTAGSINILGTQNHFQIIGDSLSVDLPYFGEQQLGGTYGTNDVGIDFEGKMDREKISFNDKKQAYELSFYMKESKENYRVFLTLYPNNQTYMTVYSSSRTTISYRGVWNVYKPREEETES